MNTAIAYELEPMSAPVEEAAPRVLYLASKTRRLIHRLIDEVAGTLSFLALCVGGWVTVQALGVDRALVQRHFTALLYVSVFVNHILYYTVSEAIWGRTVGKMMTRTHVCRPDGTPASLRQIVGRSFARLIPFAVLVYLFDRKTIWDRASGTVVVEDAR